MKIGVSDFVFRDNFWFSVCLPLEVENKTRNVKRSLRQLKVGGGNAGQHCSLSWQFEVWTEHLMRPDTLCIGDFGSTGYCRCDIPKKGLLLRVSLPLSVEERVISQDQAVSRMCFRFVWIACSAASKVKPDFRQSKKICIRWGRRKISSVVWQIGKKKEMFVAKVVCPITFVF